MQTRLQTARHAYEHAFQQRTRVTEQARNGNKAPLEERCTVLYEWNRTREAYAKLFHGRTYQTLLFKKQALTQALSQENNRLNELNQNYPSFPITYSSIPSSLSPSSIPSSLSPSSIPSSSRNSDSDKKGMELLIQLDELDKQLYVFEYV